MRSAPLGGGGGTGVGGELLAPPGWEPWCGGRFRIGAFEDVVLLTFETLTRGLVQGVILRAGIGFGLPKHRHSGCT